MNRLTSRGVARGSTSSRPGLDRRASEAFTLIEMVGVMAILAIVCAMGTTAALAYYDHLAREQERETLDELASALQLSVTRDLLIPSQTSFASQVARYSGQTAATVLTNARGNPRLLLIDPGITNSGLDLPFNQTANPLAGAGSGQLAGLRLILLSSVGGPLMGGLPAAPGGKVSAAVFSNFWAAPDGTLPAGVAWDDDPHNLCLQRIQLLHLFHPVSLNHAETTGPYTNGKVRLPGMTSFQSPSGAPSPSTRWYLQGTTLVLSNAADRSTISEIVSGPVSFTYEKGYWRQGMSDLAKSAGVRARITGADFEAAVRAFLATATATADSGKKKTWVPGNREVAEQLVNAMSNYIRLGALGPQNATSMGTHEDAIEQALLDYTDLPPGQLNKP